MKDLSNLIIGRLTIIGKSKNDNRKWEVRCSCGKRKELWNTNLYQRKVRSCGCLRKWKKRKRKDNRLTHYSKDKLVAKTYDAWCHAKARCNTPSNKDWPSYGGRGITFYEGWNLFRDFYEYVGDAPSSDHTLGRLNNDKGYEPGNVEWQTWATQNRLKRDNVVFYIDGVRMVLADVLKQFGVSSARYYKRVRGGIKPCLAATLPVKGIYRSA